MLQGLSRESANKSFRLSAWINAWDLGREAQLNRHPIDQILNLKIRLLGHALRVLQKKRHPISKGV